MTEVKVEEKIQRRVFETPGGDWIKAERMTREIMKQSEKVQSLWEEAVKEDAKLKQMILEAYKTTPTTDCLFYDSPLSPYRITLQTKFMLKKLGWEGMKDQFMANMDVQSLVNYVKDACRWLMKFRNEKV